jgi:hypothetical protein
VPGYADQSDADSQKNRMAQEEDSNMAEEGEQDGGVVVGLEEGEDSAVVGVAEQQVRPGSWGTLLLSPNGIKI